MLQRAQARADATAAATLASSASASLAVPSDAHGDAQPDAARRMELARRVTSQLEADAEGGSAETVQLLSLEMQVRLWQSCCMCWRADELCSGSAASICGASFARQTAAVKVPSIETRCSRRYNALILDYRQDSSALSSARYGTRRR